MENERKPAIGVPSSWEMFTAIIYRCPKDAIFLGKNDRDNWFSWLEERDAHSRVFCWLCRDAIEGHPNYYIHPNAEC